jgi:predicted nucleic acid-binding protein
MLLEESGIFCSAITVAEIAAGMRPREEDRTKAFIGQIEVLDVTRDVAEKAGHVRRLRALSWRGLLRHPL